MFSFFKARKQTLADLTMLLPFPEPCTTHELESNNTTALVWFAKHMPKTHGSLASQVKLYEDRVAPVYNEPCGYCGTSQDPNVICLPCYNNMQEEFHAWQQDLDDFRHMSYGSSE